MCYLNNFLSIMTTHTHERRVMTELKILKMHPDVQSYFSYESSGPDQKSNYFCIYGYLLPRTEPYKYGAYRIRIVLSAEFPFRSPGLELLTYIYHPAINNDLSDPSFCIKCFRATWTPATHIGQWLEQLVMIIEQPDASLGTYCVRNLEAHQLYQQHREQFEERALTMVRAYSHLRPPRPIVSLKFAAKQMICKRVNFQSPKLGQLPLSLSLKDYLML